MRPKQWTKNVFVLVALFFTQNVFQPLPLSRTLAAFLLFCLLSGAIYLLNDIADIEKDRKHPVKSRRPIASGRISVLTAANTAIVIAVLSLAGSFLLSKGFFFVAITYVFLESAYSYFLKHVVILDVLIVALGYVLRVIGGAEVLNAEISSWLIVCTLLLTLTIALGKRRTELAALAGQAQNFRKVFDEGYSIHLVDLMMAVVSASTLVAYALYTMSEQPILRYGARNLYITFPFVLFGLLRYIYVVQKNKGGDGPEDMILADKPILISVFLWLVLAGVIIYTS